MADYLYLGPEGLTRLWENITEYYSSDLNEIHIGNNTTTLTRDISAEGSDNIATTKYVKDLVLDTLTGGLAAVPVKDVVVNGETVLVNGAAEVNIPLLDTIVDGESVLNEDRQAIITIPLKSISINNVPVSIENYTSNIGVTVNNSPLTVKNGSINIEVPTKPSDIGAATSESVSSLSLTASTLQNEIVELGTRATNLDLRVSSTETGISAINESAGKPGGFAQLGRNGRILDDQAPEIVIPVELYDTQDVNKEGNQLPSEGELGKIYLVKDTSKVLVWKSGVYAELGGVDSQLRGEVATLTDSVGIHTSDYSNPHRVTKTQVGLENVDNTSDKDKPISSATQTALDTKMDTTSIVDNLLSVETSRPLSARQGSVLLGKINELSESVSGMNKTFNFKGTIGSASELASIENPSVGDTYQVKSEDEDNGDVYTWNGTNWIQTSTSSGSVDVSSYIATDSEIYAIIENYSKE